MMAAPGGLRSLPFNRLLPSVLTVLALCAGLTSIRFALQDKWQAAVVAIILAALLDALDGRIARRFGGVTKFGAELDSLADFLSFGVAPAVTLYLWSLQRWGGFGWVIALVFAVCAALRLARFNTRLGETDLPSWAPNFFTGLPAPAAAASALLPIMLGFELGDGFRHPLLVMVVAVGVASLMISRLPTYSFKQFRVPHRYIMPMLLAVGLIAALVMTVTWVTLSAMVMIYLATIPIAFRDYRRRATSEGTATDLEAEAQGERVFEEPAETPVAYDAHDDDPMEPRHGMDPTLPPGPRPPYTS
jgi:CDP-diacylglycerol---serine O-phosphatidyltransferase